MLDSNAAPSCEHNHLRSHRRRLMYSSAFWWTCLNDSWVEEHALPSAVPFVSSGGLVIAGMPNQRKNPFSTDFYRLFQSTDKKMIYGRIYGFFLTRFGYYPKPPLHFRDGGIVRKNPIFGRMYGFFRTEFGYYPPPRL